MKKKELLLSLGISEDRATEMIDAITKEFGVHSAKFADEQWFENLTTGRITFTRDALPHFRRRFARVGMVLDNHLQSRQFFWCAMQTVIAKEWVDLCDEDQSRCRSLPHGYPERSLADAEKRGDIQEIITSLQTIVGKSDHEH